MHIEFVEDKQDDICECCEEMILEVEDFINGYIECNESGNFTLDLFGQKLIELFQLAKETGKREAFEQIGNFSMNLAYPQVEECDCEDDDCCEDCCNCDL